MLEAGWVAAAVGLSGASGDSGECVSGRIMLLV